MAFSLAGSICRTGALFREYFGENPSTCIQNTRKIRVNEAQVASPWMKKTPVESNRKEKSSGVAPWHTIKSDAILGYSIRTKIDCEMTCECDCDTFAHPGTMANGTPCAVQKGTLLPLCHQFAWLQNLIPFNRAPNGRVGKGGPFQAFIVPKNIFPNKISHNRITCSRIMCMPATTIRSEVDAGPAHFSFAHFNGFSLYFRFQTHIGHAKAHFR